MLRLLVILVTLFPYLILGQHSALASLLTEEKNQIPPPQLQADSISSAILSNPGQASALVREALLPFQKSHGDFSEEDRMRVAAIVAAAVAASAPSGKDAIVAACVGVLPSLGSTISSAAQSVSTRVAEQAASSDKVMGNIRVLEITGKKVQAIDAQGKASELKRGQFLRQGMRIITGVGSGVVLIFENGCAVRVEQNSDFSVEKFTQAPFDGEKLDHRNISQEPSVSSTRLGLQAGNIFFDVAKLKKGSTYNIVTPVGVAGIRGTGGFVSSTPGVGAQQAGFGLYDGSASFITPSGQAPTVNQNQSIAVGGPGANFAFSPSPSGGLAALQQAQQGMAQVSALVSSLAFSGAPPSQPAPPDALSKLTPAQRQALQQAAAEGSRAVAEIAQQLAAANPGVAVDIAMAAVDLAPAVAASLASSISAAIPAQAASIAAAVTTLMPIQAAAVATVVSMALPAQAANVASAVAAVAPAQAANVASFVTTVIPSQATALAVSISTSVPTEAGAVAASVSALVPAEASAIATSVATAVPAQAASVAASVAIVVPAQAAAIASSVATAVPAQAATVAAAVVTAVPAEAASVATAVSTAVPTQAAAVSSAVTSAVANANQGGDAAAVAPPAGPPANQNPASLSTPTPTPTPVSPSF